MIKAQDINIGDFVVMVSVYYINNTEELIWCYRDKIIAKFNNYQDANNYVYELKKTNVYTCKNIQYHRIVNICQCKGCN